MLTLYTKNNCVYCKLAKDYLNSIGVEFCEIDVSKDIRAADMLKSMGLKTVPQIFYKGKLLYRLIYHSGTVIKNNFYS